jgi:hypothetical protein
MPRLRLHLPIYVQSGLCLWRVPRGVRVYSWSPGRPATSVLVPDIANTLIPGGASFLLAVVPGVG